MAATKTRKKRRSAKQRANDKRLGAMARARHRTVKTKTRAKRKARKAHKKHRAHKRHSRRHARRHAPAVLVTAPVKRRRRGKRGGHRAKHRAKHVRRGKSRGRHRRGRARKFRSIRIAFMNPRGVIGREVSSFLHGITGVKGNMHAATSNGLVGYGAAAGGAVAAVFLGTVMARFVMPAALKFMPSVAANPIGARVLSFGLYYTGAYAVARFTPGLKQSTRDAIMFGGLVAAVLEIVKPGIIAKAVGYVPVVGAIIAPKLEGIESELSDYVEEALNGLGFSSDEYNGSRGFHGMGMVSPGDNPGGFDRQVQTAAPHFSDRGLGVNHPGYGFGVLPGTALSELAGVGNYSHGENGPTQAYRGVGNYAMDGYEESLSCPMASDDGSPE